MPEDLMSRTAGRLWPDAHQELSRENCTPVELLTYPGLLSYFPTERGGGGRPGASRSRTLDGWNLEGAAPRPQAGHGANKLCRKRVRY